MNQNGRFRYSKVHGTGCPRTTLRKRAALVTVAATLVFGLTACSLNDLMVPFTGDIPFETEPTTPPEMGAVDNVPTVPDEDRFFGDIDNLPY